MPSSIKSARLLCAFLFCLVSFLPASGQTRLIISQMYGGGGNSGAPWTYDFLELYNPTSADISLNGLSIQYASATTANWNEVALPNVSVAAGHYFLIQAAAGTMVTNIPLVPAADFVISTNGSSGFALNFSATAGKVVIANTTTPLTVACPPASAYVDLIGFGATANCYEGTGPAPAPSNTTADIRNSLTTDLVNNATDFSTGAPTPHNSSSSSTPVPPPVVFIHDIQGVKSTTASTVSPYAGQRVTTSGVVTSVLSNAFFLQSRDTDADTNPLTPEGIEVFTSTTPTVALGNYVQVTGTVQTFRAVTVSKTPGTEITSPTVTVLAASSALPTAITLTASMLTPSGGLYQLTPYEGMRVAVPSLTTISGTTGSVTPANEPSETATSTGYFYAVITGTPRPFREPGIDIRDPAVPGTPAGVAHFDDNPERIIVDSAVSGGTSIELSTGAVLTNVTGVLDFTFSSDTYYDPSRLILDASYSRSNVTPGMTVQPAAPPASNEFTVASFNIERFYNTSSTDDLYYVPAGVFGFIGSSSTGTVSTGQTFLSGAADLSPAAYARRLTKLSLAIRNVLNSPDIVTLEEVENQSVANDIAAQVNTDAGVPNLYTAYSTDNSTYFTQDSTGISVGFLVKNTVDTLSVTQYGAGEIFTPTSSSSPITLNDRPWLVLTAGLKRGTGVKDYPVTVIVNHMKALTGQNSPTSSSTRNKKELQAEDIAKYIQTLQAAGDHVISGGDFNAFEFSDGYNDTLATYTNTNVLPATQVVQPGVAGLVTPPLTDLALTLPAAQRWSYQEDGDAQILDHIVVTPELVAAGAHFAYVHLDADFPLTAYNDATTPARESDHDPALGYFILPQPSLSGTLTPSTNPFGSVVLGTSSSGQVFTFTNTGEGPVSVTGVAATGDFAVTSSCTTVAINSTCSANVVFTPTATGSRTGSITFTTNVPAATYSSTLSGTGVAPALPTFSSSALTFAPAVLNTSSAAQTITVSNSGTTPVALGSPAISGDFSETTNCGASLSAMGTCTISIVFKPTATGTRTGSLVLASTGYAATTLTATLTGSGLVPDFSIADTSGNASTTISVSAGASSTMSLVLTPINAFSGVVTLSCSASGTPPPGTSCMVQSPITLSGAPVNASFTLTTASRVLAGGFSLPAGNTPGSRLTLPLIVLIMFLATRPRRLARSSRIGKLFSFALFGILSAACLTSLGCGNGSHVNPNGTPAGTYTYVVTATSGAISHSETITLNVQ